MDYDPETAISQYKYIPLHSNLGIAATLATMNLEAAIKRFPAYNTCSLVRANLDHGYHHISHCVFGSSCTPRYSSFGRPSSLSSSKHALLILQLFPLNDLFHSAKQSLISRAGEAAIRVWVYRPKHSDPSTALTLTYIDMSSASAVVGFSFCDSLEKLGQIHLNECLPKEEKRLEKLRKEELAVIATAAAAATNQPAHAAPSVSNVFKFGTVPNSMQPQLQSQPQQQRQPQQQQPSRSSNSRCTNPTPSRDPSPPTVPPSQVNGQPPHALAPPPLPITPLAAIPTPTPPHAGAVAPAPTSSELKIKKNKWSSKNAKSHKVEKSEKRKSRYSFDSSDSSSSSDDDSDSAYDSDSDSDDEAYQRWRKRFKKQKRSHASSSKKKPSKPSKIAVTKKSKKAAESKTCRTKGLARKRRTQDQYYFRPPLLSSRTPSPSSPSTPPPTSPTPKKRVRCDDEPSRAEEAPRAQNLAMTLVSDEEEEKPSKRRCRRATSAPAVTRGKTNSSSSSVSASAPAFGLSKKMGELLTPLIRNQQPLQLHEQAQGRDIKKFNPQSTMVATHRMF